MGETTSIIQTLTVWLIPTLFAITIHEFAHGWVANRLGDPTARMMGRLSLNPARHIDPVGTVLVPIIMLLFVGFMFGWAKPVPVTRENLKNPQKDMIWVALAGPGSNLLMALLWGLVIRLGVAIGDNSMIPGEYLILTGQAGVLINLILLLLNLLPIPPLDGSRVVSGLLPGPMAWKYSRIEPYGFIIIVALLFTGVLGSILQPILDSLFGFILHFIVGV